MITKEQLQKLDDSSDYGISALLDLPYDAKVKFAVLVDFMLDRAILVGNVEDIKEYLNRAHKAKIMECSAVHGDSADAVLEFIEANDFFELYDGEAVWGSLSVNIEFGE